MTAAALNAGHTVTLLNRGQSGDGPPAGVEHLKADRNGDLAVLRGRTWDAVIDVCGYYPRQVRALRGALAGAPHFTFVSSVSAYAEHARPGQDESAPLAAALHDDSIQTVDGGNYGPLKVACEEAAGADALIVRPGIIIGPHDPTGRFAYWVRRMARPGEFLAPGDGRSALQVIDARDLAEWMVRQMGARTTGAFNTVGPREPLSFADFIATGVKALGAGATPVWVPEGVLTAEKAAGPGQLPLWVPNAPGKFSGLFAIDGGRAWASGLTHRPLAQSIADVARYEAAQAKPITIGLDADREREVLTKARAA